MSLFTATTLKPTSRQPEETKEVKFKEEDHVCKCEDCKEKKCFHPCLCKACLPKSKDMMAEICSFLPGGDVFLKIAVCNQRFRKAAQVLGPMNADRIIWLAFKRRKVSLLDIASLLCSIKT
jgi:hypothetical protein